jgi:hypothetical protein
MLTNQGQLERLRLWLKSGPKYAMLINQSDISKFMSLSEIKEATQPGRKSSYKRQEITSDQWSIPTIGNGGNAEVYAQVSFGPFTDDIPVTHVGLASVEEGSKGNLYLFAPIEHFIETGEPRIFTAGEVFRVSIREEQV